MKKHTADCHCNRCAQNGAAPRKHVYIYSPSGAVRNGAAFRRGLQRLRQLGCDVEVDTAALRASQRFAGDDATRLAAIGRAAASGADAALISRGGYGLTRLLPALNYRALDKAIASGTRFIGLSDFTALQCAVMAKTGAITWAGPALVGDLGCEGEPDDIMLACLNDTLQGINEGTGWRLPKGDADLLPEGLQIDSATLWGGNLSILCSLIGTPFMPQPKRGILFLEDVNEHPYRIERMLAQLLYAGILQRQKAILLGQFTEWKASPLDRGYTMRSVLAWLRQHTRAPVLTGLPFGHVPTKVLLPVGADTSLQVQGREVLVLWGHV